MSTLPLLFDPGFRLPLLLGLGATMILSLIAIYLAGSRLLLTGLALAQSASAGAALSLLIPWPGTLLAMLATGLAAALSSAIRQRTAISDAGLLVLYLAGASGAQLLAASSGTGDAQILELLNGQLLLLNTGDALMFAATLLPLAVVIWLERRLLLLGLTQREFAQAQGFPLGRAEAWLLIAIGLVVGSAFQMLGVLCTTALLTCPGLIALSRARSLTQAPRLALFAGGAGYVTGLVVAFARDWPPGPVIAGVLVVATVASLQWPRRD